MMTHARTYIDNHGHKVDVYMTTDRPQPECMFCEQGRCVQDVHTSSGWKHDLVLHYGIPLEDMN